MDSVLPIILNLKISRLSSDLIYRPISAEDNASVAQLIRSVLKEHGVDKPGTVYTDPTTDQLFELLIDFGVNYYRVQKIVLFKNFEFQDIKFLFLYEVY